MDENLFLNSANTVRMLQKKLMKKLWTRIIIYHLMFAALFKGKWIISGTLTTPLSIIVIWNVIKIRINIRRYLFDPLSAANYLNACHEQKNCSWQANNKSKPHVRGFHH